jgi:arylformamidase
MKTNNIIDITPLVSSALAVFPGDTPFKLTTKLEVGDQSNFKLSEMQCTVHCGAHTDAPSHYAASSADIHLANLNDYYGECQVIQVDVPRSRRITINDLKGTVIQASRVLFKTLSYPDPNKWNQDFNALSEEVIEFLRSKNVKLIGIDTPSVDLALDKKLLAHNKIHQLDMRILEGIVLEHVEDGLYTLCALPLKIENADASPVRAILIKKD